MAALNRRDFLKKSLKTGTTVVGATVLIEAASKGLNRRQPFAEAAGPEPEYEIYAAKYGGPVVRKVAIVLWNVGWDEDGPINYYVWAIKAKGGEITLVDTGPSPAQGAARKVPGFVDPIDVVARIGATADSVSKVVLAKGPAVVGSDCAHVFRGYREDNPSVFIMDMPAWIQSFDKVKSKAAIDLIFPGHDVLMHQGYPKVAEDVTRLV
jgi:glyoxylase-like metal-dependent hydrolase (beta-lactamase superfamily II)